MNNLVNPLSLLACSVTSLQHIIQHTVVSSNVFVNQDDLTSFF